ncbi:MAG: hypothetical protein HZC42_14040 [Candidatus Eisenbacteria bacterium]|nr:hypothetical protein [Candidatus Eisenbacteria bacterium]
MKKTPTAVLLATALAAAGAPAQAQVFGQFTPAEILPVNAHLFGAYLDVSENVVGLLGQLRLSFYPGVDFGFQGGLDRVDAATGNRTTVKLGGDVRFATAHAGEASPVDVLVGGALGVATGDDYHVFTVGPSAVASRSFSFSPNASVAPYAGLMLAFTNFDSGPTSSTDFSIPLRLGAELKAMPGLRLGAELQLRLGDDFSDRVGFSAGVNLPF